MSDASSDKPAVPVHLVSAEPGVMPGAPAAPRKRKTGLYQTVLFVAGEAAQNILPKADDRVIAFVIALDQDMIIANSKGDAAAGIGSVIPQNVAWPVDDDEAVFAAPYPLVTGSTTARLSVSQTIEGP
jgi:hypothetical protein